MFWSVFLFFATEHRSEQTDLYNRLCRSKSCCCENGFADTALTNSANTATWSPTKGPPHPAFPLQLATHHDDAASRCDRSSTATAPVVAVLCSCAGNGDTDTGRETCSISRLAQDTARGLFAPTRCTWHCMCNTHPLARQVRFRQLFLDQLSTGQGLLKHMTRAGSALEELGLDQVSWGDDGAAATALLLLTPRRVIAHTQSTALSCLTAAYTTFALHVESRTAAFLVQRPAVCVWEASPFALTQTCTLTG